MAFEKLESILYLPDDTSFYRSIGDEFHGARVAWRAAGLLALAILFYSPAIWQSGFVWQDEGRVNLLWSWAGLAHAWSDGIGGAYRPLAQTLLWGEHHFAGLSPRLYHITSVFMHGINGILLWGVLRRLEVRGAWFAAALFVVHPVQVQAVEWISQQSNLLGAGLCLGAVWAYLRLDRIRPPLPEELLPFDVSEADQLLDPEPVKSLYAIAVGLAIGAMLSGPLAIGLPFILLLLIWWKRGSVSRWDWLRIAPFFAIAVAGVVILVVAGTGAIDPGGIAPVLTVGQRILVVSRAIWTHAALTLWPYPLLFVHPRWSMSPVEWWQYLFPAALLGSLTACWLKTRSWGRGPFVAVLLYVILLVPAIWALLGSTAPSIYLAEYHQYLALAVPLAALAWMVVGLIDRVHRPILARCIRAATGIACLTLLGVMGWMAALDYRDAETLWKSTLAQDPSVTLARAQYAILLVRDNRSAEALDMLRAGGPSSISDVALQQAWGQVYFARGQWADAIESFRKARELDPTNRELALGLAMAYFRGGRVDDALRVYHEELDRKPDEGIYNSIGQVYTSQGKTQQAIDAYLDALKLNPKSVPAKLSLSNIYFELKRFDESAKQMQEVLAIEPSNFSLWLFDAKIELRLHDFGGAETSARVATRLNGKSADAWNVLGVSQFFQEHVREAIVSFGKAVTISPDYEEARTNLDKARRKLASSDK